MIGIIDYGIGNLRSVQKAFELLGAQVTILSGPDQLDGVEKLVLPGVGAFADGMAQLKKLGWAEAIVNFIESGRPFLGICLGLQLLFQSSEEDAPSPDTRVAGLSVLAGEVTRFQPASGGGRRLKVPHMGWNSISWTRHDPLMHGLEPGVYVYFVHSYFAEPAPQAASKIVGATADYGRPFCASVWRDNVWATQFHLEKSQAVGRTMLANFASF